MVESPAVLETSHSSKQTLIELPAKPEEAAKRFFCSFLG